MVGRRTPLHRTRPHHRIDPMGLDPIVEFDMRLGEGSGAVTALPILQGAVAILGKMATFSEAGVSTQGSAPADEPESIDLTKTDTAE